jgi:hypothetical protein
MVVTSFNHSRIWKAHSVTAILGETETNPADLFDVPFVHVRKELAAEFEHDSAI